MTFTFNSKETYLQYRNDWKIKYFELVRQIRKSKQELKDEMRRYANGGSIIELWKKHRARRDAVEDIVKHLVELDNAKQEADRQMRMNRPLIS